MGDIRLKRVCDKNQKTEYSRRDLMILFQLQMFIRNMVNQGIFSCF